MKDSRKTKEEKALEKMQKKQEKQEQEDKKKREKEEKAKRKLEKKANKPDTLEITSGSDGGSSAVASPESVVGSPDSALDRSVGEDLRQSKGYTKEYEFTDQEFTTPKRGVQGFSYEKSGPESPSGDKSLSPSSGKRLTGLAFNYAPGEIDKLKKDEGEKLEKDVAAAKKAAIDYVESAAKKELQVIPPVTGDIRLIDILVDPKTGKLVTHQIDLKTGEANLVAIADKLKAADLKKQRPVKLLLSVNNKPLPGQIDAKTGEYKGYFDPSTGAFVPVKFEPKTGELREHTPSFRRQKDLKVIDLMVDPKTFKVVDKQVDLKTGLADVDTINALLTNFDVSKAQPVKLLINADKNAVLSGQIDPSTGEYLGYFDPKSGVFVPAGNQIAKDSSAAILLGQDAKPLKKVNVLVNRRNSVVADNQIDLHNGTINLKGVEDAKSNLDDGQYVPVTIIYNPVSNSVLHGQVDLKTGEYTGKLYPRQDTCFGFRQVSVAVDPKTSTLLKNQVDLTSGAINFEGISEKYNDPKKHTFVPVLVIERSNTVLAGQLNAAGEYLGHYDPDTLQFVPVRIDPRTGDIEEIKILNLLDIDLKDLKVIQVVAERDTKRILSNQITPHTGAVNADGVAQRSAELDPARHQRVPILTSPAGKKAVDGQFNPSTMKYLGLYDPATLHLLPVQQQVPEMNSEMVRFVQIKVDPKNGKVLSGQIDAKTAHINEQAIDFNTGKNKLAADGSPVLVLVDKPTKKVLGGQIDLKHGKVVGFIDPVTWEWCEGTYDPKKGGLVREGVQGSLDPVTGLLSSSKSPEPEDIAPLPVFESGIIQAIEVQLDPKNGRILDGVVDPKTGLVNSSKVDLETGRLLNPADRRKVITSHVLIVKTSRKLIPGQVEPKHGKLVGKIDPTSFKLIHVDLDPKTGGLIEGKVKGQVNPASGAVIEYEVDKSGKLKDPKSGKLIEYEIDPNTGILIDPKTGKSLVGQIGDAEGAEGGIGVAVSTPGQVQDPEALKAESQYPANFAAQGEKLSPTSQRALDIKSAGIFRAPDYDEGIKEGKFPYGGAGEGSDPNAAFIQQEQRVLPDVQQRSPPEPTEKRSHGFSGISAIFGKDDKKKKDKSKKEKDSKKPKEKPEKKKEKKQKKEKKEKKAGGGDKDDSSSSSSDSDSDSSSGLSEYGEGQEEAKDLKGATKLKIPKLHLKGKKAEEKSPSSPVDEKSPKEEKGKTKIPKFAGWKSSPSEDRPKSPEEKLSDAGSPKSPKSSRFSGTNHITDSNIFSCYSTHLELKLTIHLIVLRSVKTHVPLR